MKLKQIIDKLMSSRPMVCFQSYDIGYRQPLDVEPADIGWGAFASYYPVWNGLAEQLLGQNSSLDVLMILPRGHCFSNVVRADETLEAVNSVMRAGCQIDHVDVIHFEDNEIKHLKKNKGITMRVGTGTPRGNEAEKKEYFENFFPDFRNKDDSYSIPKWVIARITPQVIGNWPKARANLKEFAPQREYDLVVFLRDAAYLKAEEKGELSDWLQGITKPDALYVGYDILQNAPGWNVVKKGFGFRENSTIYQRNC